jgi:hypothetical protein
VANLPESIGRLTQLQLLSAQSSKVQRPLSAVRSYWPIKHRLVRSTSLCRNSAWFPFPLRPVSIRARSRLSPFPLRPISISVCSRLGLFPPLPVR